MNVCKSHQLIFIILAECLFLLKRSQTNFVNLYFTQFQGQLAVSFAIPLYNRRQYLNRSIMTILSQTLHSYEITICDDYSTDGSYEYALKLQNKFKSIKIIRLKSNMGTYVARKTSILHSLGQYILSVDPDDAVSKDIALIDLSAIQLTSSDILEHKIICVNSSTNEMFPYLFAPPKFRRAPHSVFVKDFLHFRLNWNLPRKMIKRCLFVNAFHLIETNLSNSFLIYGEDCLIMAGIYFYSHTMCVIKNILYFYYKGIPDSSLQRINRLNQRALQKKVIDTTISRIYHTNFHYA